MPKYFDQHLHTHHSFDSTETFEHYLNHDVPAYFISTEHLDFKNPYDGGKDSIPDYHAYSQEIDSLNQQHDITILKGIEVGYVKEHLPLINDYLASKEYDIILLSVHQNGIIDYMDDVVVTMDQTALITDYYTRMLDAVMTVDFANVLTHFDYGVRRLEISVADYKAVAEPYLIQIFSKAIEKNLAFELNAKSFVKYGNQALYEYGIPLYQSLGGTLFTLGSDAHQHEDYELGFEEMKELLKRYGVTQLATYRRQKLHLVELH